MASGPITSWQIDGEKSGNRQILFSWPLKSLQMVTATMKLKMLAPWKKSYDQPRQHIKKQRHHFANKDPSSQSYGFSSSHVWMWKLYIKKAEHWRTDAFELWCWSPLDSKEIQPVHPKGNQSWIFLGRSDAEAEAPILWPPAVKSWPIRKDPDAGKDWGQEKDMTVDEMFGWHHRFNGHEFE